MPKGLSTQELDAIKSGIDEFKVQFVIWDAIKKLQDKSVSTNQPRYKKDEQVVIGQNKYVVNDLCSVNGHFVYQLAITENKDLKIIAIEDIISKA